MVKDPGDSFLVSKTWAAKAFRITIDALSRWDVAPAKRKKNRTWFDIRDLIEHLRNRQEGAGAVLSKERAEWTRQQRMKLEREEAVKSGLLLSAETVAGEWCNVFTLIRQRLLNAAARVEQIAEDEIAEIIRAEVHSALDDLAGFASDRYPAADPGNVPHTGKGNGRGMGRRKQSPKRGGRRRARKVAH